MKTEQAGAASVPSQTEFIDTTLWSFARGLALNLGFSPDQQDEEIHRAMASAIIACAGNSELRERESVSPEPTMAELVARVRATRRAYLELHGVPLSMEFVHFAEAMGDLCTAALGGRSPFPELAGEREASVSAKKEKA